MELTTQYIASQIVTIFVYVFLSLTYCIKNRKLILAFSFASNFLNAIAFILLGAYTSAAMCTISIFRDIIFMVDQKINGKSDTITKKDVALLCFVYGLSTISIIFTFKGFWTLLYAVDSIYIKSVFGVILQTVVLICSGVSTFANKEEKKEKINYLTSGNYECVI